MRKHSNEKIKEIKNLRREGYSINDIVAKTGVPKTTIWHHIHNIKLSPKHIALIKMKQGGSKIRSQNEWLKSREQAREVLSGGNKYPCALMAMLYWAEGNKEAFAFTNTDGKMIKLCLIILKKYFKIKETDIKLTLRIFTNLNRNKCLRYWSEATELPKNKLIIYLNDGGTRGKAQYGICRLTVKKGGYLLKLMNSLINNITDEILNN